MGRGPSTKHTREGRGVKKKAVTFFEKQPEVVTPNYFNGNNNCNSLETVTANNWEKFCGKTPDGQALAILYLDNGSVSGQATADQQRVLFSRAYGLSKSELPRPRGQLGRVSSLKEVL